MVKKFLVAVLTTSIFTASAQTADLPGSLDLFDSRVSEIDVETLERTQAELKLVRNVLIQIRNSQQPGLISKTGSMIGSVSSEAFMLLLSVVVAACLTSSVHGKNILDYLKLSNITNLRMPDLEKRELTKIIPTFILSILGSEIVFHIVAKVLTSDDSNDQHNIKESLNEINRVISKFDYEIKKVDRVTKRLQSLS